PLALRVTLPWAGSLSLVAVRVLASASVSLARTLAAVLSRTVTVPPSATVALSPLATGASLTGVTVIETVAVPLHLGSGEPLVVPLSQEIGRASCREGALTSGLELTVPLTLRVTLPWAGSLSLVAVRVLPSASVSFAGRLAVVLSRTVTVPPWARVALLFLATGASLTGVTVIETVAVPLHLGSGEPLVVPLSQ